MAATAAPAHQSSNATTSLSSRGNATTSGGAGSSPRKPRTTSRYDLPYVCDARSYVDVEQIGSSEVGGATLGARRVRSSSAAGERTSTSDHPKRDPIAIPSLRAVSGDRASSSHPQPHHDRR